MNELESTDLICEARRRELSEREQRRLEDLVSTDLDATLMMLMQPELERESRVQRGDDALARRIAERAVLSARLAKSEPESARPLPLGVGVSRRLRGPTWLLAAAAILLVGTGSAAWKLVRPNPIEALTSAANEDTSGTGLRHASSSSRGADLAASRHAPVSPPPDASAPPPAPVLDSAASQPASTEAAVARSQEVSKCRDCGARSNGTNSNAARLFGRANLLRRDGHTREALQLYRQLLAEHQAAPEAALARLVLAKSLAGSNPKQALAHYQELARAGGSLRAEALWGIAETATALSQPTLKQQALTDLAREFPDSAYAEVARRDMRDAAR